MKKEGPCTMGSTMRHRLSLTAPHAVRNVWIIWIVLFVVIATIVAMPSNRRTVTPIYRISAINWYEGKDLYTKGIDGYLYLPHACILYAPFARLPFSVSEVLWRALTIGLLAIAVWRLARFGGRDMGRELFPLMSLLVIPTALECARNGQVNLPLATLMTFAGIDLAMRRWWAATLWLVLALALKPTVMVMLALTALLYAPMRWRLAAGLAALFVFPFMTQQPSYVFEQYKLYTAKLRVAGSPDELDYFSDVFGLLGATGINVPTAVRTVFRLVAAAATFGLCRLALNRWGHIQGTVLFFSFNVCYLMLFNPRTENNTYVIAGMPMALFAAWALLCDRWRVAGAVLAALVLIMSATHEITRGVNHWVSPTACLLFSAYLIFLLVADVRPAAVRLAAGRHD